jgi:hypothetical protein
MVALATANLSPLGSRAEIAAGEKLKDFSARHLTTGGGFSMVRSPTSRHSTASSTLDL